ncbi:transglycosylase SLT domain-containing protein [Thaumasiovibrio sp. DFM-14]|uniref:transglycosylase SLT domain-containing protein n=1 Tax=Thaumasiovibrio sp. DFM-14 TaxID=3384792 RepID=UPI0039A2DB6F
MKKYLLPSVISCVLFSSTIYADSFADLEQAVAELNRSPEEDRLEFQAWYKAHLQEYSTWRKAFLEKWDAERASSVIAWGDTQVDSEHVAVLYEENQRTVIDFEANELVIEVRDGEMLSNEQLESFISQQLANPELNVFHLKGEDLKETVVIEQRDISYSVEQEREALREILKQANLQLQDIDKTASSIEMMSQHTIDDDLLRQEKETLVVDAKSRMNELSALYQEQRDMTIDETPVITYRLKMPNSSLEKRVAPYLDDIYHQSEVFDVEPALIVAIMHSESSFNPRARSPIPAFGLMQVVTTSAGHDVNRIVHNVDRPMNEQDLYQPEYNIEAGTAYLDILNSRYLRAIKDPQSREYCVIAAYNTGAGNVARAFGERRLSAAVEKINTLSPQEVYENLMANLPYEETIHYLKKVTERKEMYQGQI